MTKINLTCHLDHDDKVQCGNCDWKGLAPEMDEITDLDQRVIPGESVPAGECPKCSALAFLIDEETPRGRAYRRLRILVKAHNPTDRDLNDRLLEFAKTHTLRAMALMAAYHDSDEEGLPQTRFDAVHAFLFAAVLCACEKNLQGVMPGVLAFDNLNDQQREALHELLKVADDMICTTLDAVAIEVPEGLEAAALDPNMTKQ